MKPDPSGGPPLSKMLFIIAVIMVLFVLCYGLGYIQG